MTLLLALVASLHADPCGMVPPIALSGDQPGIERTGAQRTYVSYHSGVETMVLRPGFVGSVEDFGMLIPFPSAPALRKIDDATFEHIEAAIDPPTIHVQHMMLEAASVASGRGGMMTKSKKGDSRENTVTVLNQEAVGMYQVAVLEAGSANALKAWMKDNGYRFPTGMEDVANEYIDISWCFVVIKARVGSGEGVTPRPGMRQADATRPANSTFDGHVQGMGFRFEVDAPVIPMRLSVFNGEDPRNVVYLLTDEPVRIAEIPGELVVRQLPGEVLRQNLTGPLPIKGEVNSISDQDRVRLDAQRDPARVNGVARDLFAADLLAVRTGQLSLPFEETEKRLLSVSEAFGMRGADTDRLHGAVLAEQKAVAVDGALDDLNEMHVSVLDGVFPHKVLAATNLHLELYRMPKQRNLPRTDPLVHRQEWFYLGY